jgi:hypothetical protein
MIEKVWESENEKEKKKERECVGVNKRERDLVTPMLDPTNKKQ